MKRSIIAAALALFALAATSHAQTTGGYALDALSHQLNATFTCSFTDGNEALVLSHRATGTELITLSSVVPGVISMSAIVGRVNNTDHSRRGVIESYLSTTNTRLPIGTLTLDDDGLLHLDHHVGFRFSSISELTSMVVRMVNEAEMHRMYLLG